MRLENFIVQRYIKELRKNSRLSDAAFIVVSVITVALIFYFSACGIMNGYVYNITKIAVEIRSFHISYEVSTALYDAKYNINLLSEDKRVRFADYYRETKVLLNATGKNTGLFYFRVVNEDVFKKDTGLDKSIRLTSGNKTIGLNEILISDKTAQKLRVRAGDYLFAITMSDQTDSKLRYYRLKVSGTFTTGFTELDEQLAYIGNITGDKIFSKELYYKIGIKLKDFKDTDKFISDYSNEGMNDMRSWEEINGNELTALKFEKNMIAFIVILVLIVALLNLMMTINITVLEKRQNIGILKSIGFSPDKIVLTFLLYGVYLSLIGIAIGIILGLFIMYNLNSIMEAGSFIINIFNTFIYNFLSIFTISEKPDNIEIFSKEFYFDKIYTDISLAEIIFITILTFLISVITSVIPAIKAGSIKPNEVLKND